MLWRRQKKYQQEPRSKKSASLALTRPLPALNRTHTTSPVAPSPPAARQGARRPRPHRPLARRGPLAVAVDPIGAACRCKGRRREKRAARGEGAAAREAAGAGRVPHAPRAGARRRLGRRGPRGTGGARPRVATQGHAHAHRRAKRRAGEAQGRPMAPWAPVEARAGPAGPGRSPFARARAPRRAMPSTGCPRRRRRRTPRMRADGRARAAERDAAGG